MLHPALDDAVDDLLVRWRLLDDARRSGATLPAIAEARWRLEAARDRVHLLRRSLAPELRELEESVSSVRCEVLDETVFLFRSHADDAGAYICACGGRVSPHSATG